jgi:hypothetical protein
MDIDDIPFGTDFRTHIQDKLKLADVLVALVGTQWTGASEGRGARMQDEKDPVRMEIETAVAQHVPIIPVLVDGAKMPESTQLPETFGNFAFLNAADVATGRDFHAQVDRLIGAIDRASGAAAGPTLSMTSSKLKSEAADTRAWARKRWLADVLLYFGVALVLLLVAHHIIVNALDLGNEYIRIVNWLLPLVFGFTFFQIGARGTGAALAFAVALGIVATGGMATSVHLFYGDPILPETPFEWRDTIQFAGSIALSFMIGYAAARAWRRLGRKAGMR